LGDLKKRGVTLKDGQTLKNLYLERVPYYKQYADIRVSCERRSIQKIALEIATQVKKFKNNNEDRESM
jgi:shikimate kinase